MHWVYVCVQACIARVSIYVNICRYVYMCVRGYARVCVGVYMDCLGISFLLALYRLMHTVYAKNV